MSISATSSDPGVASSFPDAPLFLFARFDHCQLGFFLGKQAQQFLPLRFVCFGGNLYAIVFDVQASHELVHRTSLPLNEDHSVVSHPPKGEKCYSCVRCGLSPMSEAARMLLEFFRTEQRGKRALRVRGSSRQAVCARTTIAIARQNLIGILPHCCKLVLALRLPREPLQHQ